MVYKGERGADAPFSTVVADLDDVYIEVPGAGWRIRERRMRTVFRAAGVR